MHTVSLRDLNIEKDFKTDESKTIFDSLQDQGYELPHGCLAGSCGTCKIEVLSGEENLSSPGEIEQDTIESICESNKIPPETIIRLACRAKAHGDCSIKSYKKSES